MASSAGEPIEAFVVNTGGTLHAWVNRCRHVALTMDWVENRFLDDEGFIVCATHGGRYRSDTGECVLGPPLGRHLIRVPLREGRTLHHDVLGRHGAGKVFLRAAPPGTGIIAGGPMRAVFETLGMQDVVAKSLGSSNPYNMVRATFDALSLQDSPRSVAARRGAPAGGLTNRSGAMHSFARMSTLANSASPVSATSGMSW